MPLTVAQLEQIKNPKQRSLAKKFVRYNELYDAEVDFNMTNNKETSAKQERYYDVASEAFSELNAGTIKIIQRTVDTIGY